MTTREIKIEKDNALNNLRQTTDMAEKHFTGSM